MGVIRKEVDVFLDSNSPLQELADFLIWNGDAEKRRSLTNPISSRDSPSDEKLQITKTLLLPRVHHFRFIVRSLEIWKAASHQRSSCPWVDGCFSAADKKAVHGHVLAGPSRQIFLQKRQVKVQTLWHMCGTGHVRGSFQMDAHGTRSNLTDLYLGCSSA